MQNVLSQVVIPGPVGNSCKHVQKCAVEMLNLAITLGVVGVGMKFCDPKQLATLTQTACPDQNVAVGEGRNDRKIHLLVSTLQGGLLDLGYHIPLPTW